MSIVRVAFQYDYQCDQIGMFAFLVKVTDFTTAAKCVMAMGNPDLTLEIRREALTLAAQNPQLVASWTHDEDGAFHHLSDEWCQDLILATLQAVEAKNTVWLGAFLRTFGHEAATTAIRSWHALGCKLASSQQLQELVNGDAFQFINSGDVQFIWTPDWLAPERHAPRLHDRTFAARRFRTTPWRKNLGDPVLFQPVVVPGEPVGLVIRMKDVKFTLVLSQLFRQRLENQTPGLQRTIRPATAGFIGNMVHMLMGNICSLFAALYRDRVHLSR
jgi:hypothetical protein